MKYCILIGDGMADDPHARLSGRTPLEAARTPQMDALARDGLLGQVQTCPARFEPGSDVANMTICGYDPSTYHTGRAPIEALAAGIELGPDDLVFRCNLITTYDNLLADYSGGHISSKEARLLVALLQQELGGDGLEFHPGNSYRNLLVVRDAGDLRLKTTLPHEIPGQSIEAHLPQGDGAARFTELMFRSRELLEGHEVNTTRRDLGENPANMIWLWGQGRTPSLPSFQQQFGLRGAVISAVDVVKGLGIAMGWDVLDVPGMTGYIDTNYRGKAEAALTALQSYDLLYVHVEAPDEVSHEGELQKKIQAIEAIDRELLEPLRAGLEAIGEHRLALLPDHVASVTSRTHGRAPVPFAVAGSGLTPSRSEGFSESLAGRSKLKVKKGVQWMGLFLQTPAFGR